MLVSHFTACVEVDPLLERIRSRSTANARAGRLRRPDRPRETERSLVPDRRQDLLPSAVIASHARKSLSVIGFRQVRRQPVSAFTSCVNGAPQRKIASPQWDSRTRPAKRQHHRCIGCEKLVFLPFLGLRITSALGLSSVTAFFRTSQMRKILQSELRSSGGRSAKQGRFVRTIAVSSLQRASRILSVAAVLDAQSQSSCSVN
jgi:hypothetical protein